MPLKRLLRFAVKRVLLAEPAVLVELDAVRGVLFVLHGIVVPLLALGAGQHHFGTGNACHVRHLLLDVGKRPPPARWTDGKRYLLCACAAWLPRGFGASSAGAKPSAIGNSIPSLPVFPLFLAQATCVAACLKREHGMSEPRVQSLLVTRRPSPQRRNRPCDRPRG